MDRLFSVDHSKSSTVPFWQIENQKLYEYGWPVASPWPRMEHTLAEKSNQDNIEPWQNLTVEVLKDVVGPLQGVNSFRLWK